jgi:multiple antibiotic resistance protein
VRSVNEQAITTGVLALCLTIIFCILAFSRLIFRLVGRPGIEILSRVSGLILASIGVNGILIATKMSLDAMLKIGGGASSTMWQAARSLSP